MNWADVDRGWEGALAVCGARNDNGAEFPSGDLLSSSSLGWLGGPIREWSCESRAVFRACSCSRARLSLLVSWSLRRRAKTEAEVGADAGSGSVRSCDENTRSSAVDRNPETA